MPGGRFLSAVIPSETAKLMALTPLQAWGSTFWGRAIVPIPKAALAQSVAPRSA